MQNKLVVRMSKFFAAVSSCLSVLNNYFDGPRKLLSDLYLDLSKFSDTSAKLFFLSRISMKIFVVPILI